MHRRRLITALLGVASVISGATIACMTAPDAQAATQPVQTPIRGTEDLGDLSQPEQALAQFYKAFANRDIAMMQDNWENSDDAVLDNPLGGIRRGWSEIRKVYERVFSSTAKVSLEFYDYTLVKEGGVFWVAGRERGTVTKESNSLSLAIRTSRIFRLRDGRWHQVHHHGSFEDPKLLAAYQELIR